jgi:hypothetical protein
VLRGLAASLAQRRCGVGVAGPLLLWRAVVILAGVTGQPSRQRRRGEELEAALCEAAWDELVQAGFARLTMESVAARARTGVAVLYRRWSGKDELVIVLAFSSL